MGKPHHVFIAAGGARITECFDAAVFQMTTHRSVFHRAHAVSGGFAGDHVFGLPRLFLGRTHASGNQADNYKGRYGQCKFDIKLCCHDTLSVYSLISSRAPHSPICFPEMMTIPWTPAMLLPAAMAFSMSLGV